MSFGSGFVAGANLAKKKKKNDVEGSFKAALANQIDTPETKGMFTGNTIKDVIAGEKVDDLDKTLLDAIARNEGTYDTGYDTEYAYGKFTPNSPKKLTEMTVAEVLAHQDTMKANQSGNKLISSAAGRYQMLQQTIEDEVKFGNISKDTKFTGALQDKMILQRLKRMRKYDAFKKGELPKSAFESNLAREFASVVDPTTGEGHYGQGAKELQWM